MDMTEALNRWGDAARKGDAEAQFNLGATYAYESGTPPDFKTAYGWYLKAANQGHAAAQNHLGWMYAHAQSVPQDDKKAVKWFRLAADQNKASGQNNLGWMLQNGRGCKQDDKKAAAWYRKSAKQDCQRGQLHYGLMCRDGRGVKKNGSEALRWLRAAADKGDVDADYELGALFENGIAVPGDRHYAINNYRNAARKGHVEAQARLQALGVSTQPMAIWDTFEFTRENLKRLLPTAKIKVIDHDNMIVETRLGEKLPTFRIRVTRSPKYAPTKKQICIEFDKHIGKPDGWFAGLPKKEKKEYFEVYLLRGNTSFTSSTEDAVIWLAGLRARKGTRKVDRTSVRVGTAGTDTFHHEYFHVMMEMLRRGKAMSDDYVRAMASRYPARITRNEPFNEETAGEAYARHAMKAPPGTNSEPWRFGS